MSHQPLKIIHICDGWEKWNGAAGIARLIGAEQSAAGHKVAYGRFVAKKELEAADEVWIHCGWKPCLWRAAWIAGKKAKWMPEACYDPVRLKYHAWKKVLAGVFERFFLRRCRTLVATCEAERDWILAYLGRRCPPIEIQNIQRFFDLEPAVVAPADRGSPGPLHVMYLGRPHPLKGVVFLERAITAINENAGDNPGNALSVELHEVSGKQGEEMEREWSWCDVLCLPTLSDNFGLVVAEALARGKRVITTDGAPAWGGEGLKGLEGEEDIGVGYGGRLIYLRGYRDGTNERRVALLKRGIESCLSYPSYADGSASLSGGNR